MIPIFNILTTKFKGMHLDISVGEWKSNMQTTFALEIFTFLTLYVLINLSAVNLTCY